MRDIDYFSYRTEDGRRHAEQDAPEFHASIKRLEDIYANSNTPEDTIERFGAVEGEHGARQVIATLVNTKPFDGRISTVNRDWARNVVYSYSAAAAAMMGFYSDAIHPANLDMLASYLRRAERARKG